MSSRKNNWKKFSVKSEGWVGFNLFFPGRKFTGFGDPKGYALNRKHALRLRMNMGVSPYFMED